MNTETTTNTQAFISNLEQVLDQLWFDEERDYEGRDEADRAGHVFPAMQSVRRWLDANRSELLRDRRYNGWSNYETWAVNLWLSNTEEDYLYWRDAARQCRQLARTHHWVREGTSTPDEAARYLLAEQLRVEVTDACLPHTCDLPSDLLSASFSEVDWHEVAIGFLVDLAGHDSLRVRAVEIK